MFYMTINKDEIMVQINTRYEKKYKLINNIINYQTKQV